MNPRSWLAFLVACLACGLPLWPIPYAQVSMPGNPAATTWLMAGSLAGLLAALLHPRRWRLPIGLTGAGFVAAVVSRVAVETLRDPTSHNLWPFEVVIAGGIGLMAGLLGTSLAHLVQRTMAPRTPQP